MGRGHAAREQGSTGGSRRYTHGARANGGVHICLSEALGPSSGGFARSEAQKPCTPERLSGSRPIQQRLVYVEAGQSFSIQRVKVLTPHVSRIHCRLTRGRSLVRSQSGPQGQSHWRAVRNKCTTSGVWLMAEYVIARRSGRCHNCNDGRTYWYRLVDLAKGNGIRVDRPWECPNNHHETSVDERLQHPRAGNRWRHSAPIRRAAPVAVVKRA